MKKTVGIALVALGLTSCTTVNKLPCYASDDEYYFETEAIHENLTEEEYYELIAQEYAPNSKEVN